MASVVVLVLALFAPALSLPFATPEYIPEIQIDQETPVISNVPQIQSGVQEKAGAPVSTGCSAGYPAAVNQGVVQPVTRVQDAPVNVEQTQVPHTETLFLPPQPVPVTQADQIVRPVIVPAEAIASGRVIIMAVEPVQQRAFPDVIIVPQQQPIISETPIHQVQSVEKQTPYQENYSTVQSNSNAQQFVQPNFDEKSQQQSQVKSGSTQQQDYSEQQAVEKQVYQPVVQVQPTQEQVVQQVEPVEKHVQSGPGYVPVKNTIEPAERVQAAETVQQEHYDHQKSENQLHGNLQQVKPEPQQQVYTAQVVPENVQKQVECAPAQTEPEPQLRVNIQETGEQTQQAEVKTHQQQPYSVQPEQVVQQVQSVEPQGEVHQQVSQVQVTKTENQQVRDAPQQVSTLATEQVYNFGDKIPQQHPVGTPVQQQQYLAQPVVVDQQ